MGKKIGYARVSMISQDLRVQIDALVKEGVLKKNIYTEKLSGKIRKADRPALTACMENLLEGDTLVVWKLDRLGRSLIDLVSIMQEIESRNIRFHSISDNIDTSTTGGKLMFHILAAIAEFERSTISERCLAGIKAAKARGISGGRPRKLTSEDVELLVKMHSAGTPIKSLIKRFKSSRTCLYRYIQLYKIENKKKD